MKFMLLLSILFSAIALPVLGELTDADLNKIRLIINEEIKPIKADIVSLQTDNAWIRGKLESIDKQFEGVDKQFEGVGDKFASIERQIGHTTNIMYGLIALIVAAISIPQILIAWRSAKDRTLERQIQTLIQEVETIKKRQIVSP